MPKLKQTEQEIQNNHFRAAIAQQSELRDMTSEYLAKLIDVSPATFRDRRRNPGRCSLSEFRKLCKTLGFTAEQVCNICGVKYDPVIITKPS